MSKIQLTLRTFETDANRTYYIDKLENGNFRLSCDETKIMEHADFYEVEKRLMKSTGELPFLIGFYKELLKQKLPLVDFTTLHSYCDANMVLNDFLVANYGFTEDFTDEGKQNGYDYVVDILNHYIHLWDAHYQYFENIIIPESLSGQKAPRIAHWHEVEPSGGAEYKTRDKNGAEGLNLYLLTQPRPDGSGNVAYLISESNEESARESVALKSGDCCWFDGHTQCTYLGISDDGETSGIIHVSKAKI